MVYLIRDLNKIYLRFYMFVGNIMSLMVIQVMSI